MFHINYINYYDKTIFLTKNILLKYLEYIYKLIKYLDDIIK